MSEELRSRGYSVLDINKHIREHGLLDERDEARDTYSVDIDGLNLSLEEYRHEDNTIFMDSHLSHCTDCSAIIVMRCHPDTLADRLRARGYSEEKVRENVQAEILDVILCEATESDIPVYEIDCTECTVAESADVAESIIRGDGDSHLPGKTDWTEEMDIWF